VSRPPVGRTGFWDHPTERARKRRGKATGGAETPAGPKANGHDAEPAYGAPHWWDAALKNKQGNLHTNVRNAALTLAEDSLFKGLLAYDEMRRCAVTLREVPNQENPCEPGRVDDFAITGIQCCLQRWYPKLGVQIATQAIDDVAMRRRFHPLRNWLDSLVWDGEPRLNMLLPAYFGATDTDPSDDSKPSPYLTMIGPMFLLSMVARIYRPGCQCDYMLCLEGDQGTLKSSACRVLAGEYFSDNLPKLHNGDRVRIATHLRGHWLIEVAEMASLDRAEASDLKEFLSQTCEVFTPKFGRTEVVEPRMTVFVGTTNSSAYLRDSSGARRFWPVKTGFIDLAALARDRDQLFAEAVARFKAGEPFWPSPEDEARYFRPEQNQRFQSDEAWENVVRAYLDSPYDNEESARSVGSPWPPDKIKHRTTILLIAREALFIDKGRIGTVDQRRIASILEHAGWFRGPRNEHGIPWVRPR
jgi:predicted P-loop ATPase